MWHHLTVRSRRRVDLIDVTEEVDSLVRKSEVQEGLVVLYTEHTTAGLFINENEPNLLQDVQRWLEEMVPQDHSYAHNRVDNNADSHLRAILLGSSLSVPLVGGRLGLGQWQRLFLAELDGPRTRRLLVGIVKG
ncbi:MAG: secondary thiamine-phosphate synthase enzyme YjbQ [Armatimonadota bacterium]|nr:secondary thiamine-phosphate synthase enzyme YjbQ [Armatimonadota bacterium]MDR7435254.1 secondary thiamine-phosphate synthase enzyme YjbQ [Armatimonadota bacterium]